MLPVDLADRQHRADLWQPRQSVRQRRAGLELRAVDLASDFDFGAREANLDLARALEVEQVANYDRTVQQAFREVSDALAGREYLAEQIATLERARIAQSEIARIARARYREGVADYLEVLDAERNLFSAEQQLLATRRAWLQNRATLFVSLGGGAGVTNPGS